MATVQHQSSPGLSEKPNDWESIFENSDVGFIPLIERARSIEALRRSTHTVIRMLFTRKIDDALRKTYENELDNIIPGDGGGMNETIHIDEAKAKAIELLRLIKDSRIQRDYSKERLEDQALSVQECDSNRLLAVFADTICEWLDQRFRILNARAQHDLDEGQRLPFILSKRFVERFEEILRCSVIPDLAGRSRGLLHRVGELPEDQWKVFLADYLADRKGRVVMWEAWQEAWKNTTVEKPVPPRPSTDKNMLSKFRKKKTGEEEWKAEVRKIRDINKIIRNTWAEFTAPSEYFLPPEDRDNKLLMDIFGRNISNLKDQVNAISQIVKQGGNVGMAFDRYQKGKNVDLALLVACYRSPEIFLGKGAALEHMLKGHKGHNFPLITRYLPDYKSGG